MAHRRSILGTLAALALLAVVARPGDPAQSAPRITVSPSTVKSGQDVTVSWQGFTDLSRGTLTLGDKRVWHSYLQHHQVTFSIPAGIAPGQHTLILSDSEGHRASATLTVTAADPPTRASITVKPAVTAPGRDVALTWHGFTNLGRGRLTLGGQPVWSSYLQHNPLTLSVPPGLAPGEYTLTLSDTEGHEASTTLTVEGASRRSPTVTAAPNPAKPGQSVTLSMTGFAAGETLTTTLGGRDLTSPSDVTDRAGALKKSITLPAATKNGSYRVVATDSDRHSAATDLIVSGTRTDANVGIQPTTGYAGLVIDIEGDGWQKANRTLVLRAPSGEATPLRIRDACDQSCAPGHIRWQAQIPAGAPPGTYRLTVSDAVATVDRPFRVVPSDVLSGTGPRIGVTPTTGSPGTWLTIRGDDLRANTIVTVLFGDDVVAKQGEVYGALKTDANGVLKCVISIPVKPPGDYTVTVLSDKGRPHASFRLR